MLQKLSDIPQWQNNKLDLFPLSIYGGEISKLNPEDQIDDELDKLWAVSYTHLRAHET